MLAKDSLAAGRFLTGPRSKAIVCSLNTNEDLGLIMKRFWEIEQGTHRNELTLEERKCEEHFEANYKRNVEGRFIVKLPIKQEEMSRLGQSKDIAIRRFKKMEKRLERDPSMKNDYREFMREYLRLGHMREV